MPLMMDMMGRSTPEAKCPVYFLRGNVGLLLTGFQRSSLEQSCSQSPQKALVISEQAGFTNIVCLSDSSKHDPVLILHEERWLSIYPNSWHCFIIHQGLSQAPYKFILSKYYLQPVDVQCD